MKIPKYLLVSFVFLLSVNRTLAQQQPRTNEAVNSQSLPIEFEPNLGQAPTGGLYIARTQSLLITLDRTELGVAFRGSKARERNVSFRFENADPNTKLNVPEAMGGESNYLIGSVSSWHTHIPHFARVTYDQLYTGIDLVFHSNGSLLEHDFIIAPGADPGRIRIRVLGEDARTSVTAAGDLNVATGEDILVMHKPEIYQIGATQKQPVEGHFTLLASGEISFAIGEYDKSRPLVIDPSLSVSTYLADLSLNVSAIATDAVGNSYVTGLTFSSSYPVTPGGFQPNCASCAAGHPDVFITKLNPTGSAQVYSTFLGGNDNDQPFGLAVDAAGNAIVAGYTQSADFPTKNSITHGNGGVGTTYGFISSLSADGSALNYSSLLGGASQQFASSNTIVDAVTVDHQGNAYIGGQTDSDMFPITAMHCCKAGVFVAKFLPSGILGYSSLIGDPTPQNGGGGMIGVSALKVDGSESAYVSGQAGTLWPITAGAYQQQIGGDMPYAAPFISKLTPDGTALVYSTYLGNGSVNGLAPDSAGNAWVTGTPSGPNFPTTSNAYQPIEPASNCCVPFFSKLDATGSNLLYSSFFYGNGNAFSTPSAIALDAAGNLWLSGSTRDPQWPLFHPIQGLPGNLLNSNSTGFISRFNSTGTKLTFSTFFGGPSGGIQIAGLALDGSGKVHIAGFAADDLYTTRGAFLPNVTPPPPYYDYTYGFAAVISPNTNSSAVCIAYPYSQGLFFGYVPVGTTAKQTLTISNCGTSALAITAFQVSAAAFTIPDSTNGCKQQVVVTASCTLIVNFTPTSATSYAGTLTFTSNASMSSALLSLGGTGAVPQIQTNQQSVVFDPQFLNQTSPAQYVFVTNIGFAPLAIDLAHTTINGDFAYTQSGCAQPLLRGAQCFLLLRFTPTAAGQRTGTLSIASNDPLTPVLAIALSSFGYSAYPRPAVSGVNPPTIAIGQTSVTLSVYGTNFFPASVAKLNGNPVLTTYQNSTLLQAVINPALLGNMRELKLSVFNPTPGGGLSNVSTITVYKSVPIDASALVYEPKSKLLFAAIPSRAAINPNSIVSIAPLSGTMSRPIPVGNDPEKLALSDDGHYLYVALATDHAIQRINLQNRRVEKTFALPVDPAFGQLTVAEMKVVPGSPQELVAALFREASPAEDGISSFNDAGLVNWLPNDFQHGYVTVDSFAFAGNPLQVYALPFTCCNNPFFSVFSIDNSGIHVQQVVSNNTQQGSGSIMASDGNLLYTNWSQVWDPGATKLLGIYNPQLFGASAVVPDKSTGHTFLIDQFAQYEGFQAVSVDSYDQQTFNQKSSVSFLNVYSPDVFGLNRWGQNGFAFLVGDFVPTDGSNQLIIFRSSTLFK